MLEVDARVDAIAYGGVVARVDARVGICVVARVDATLWIACGVYVENEVGMCVSPFRRTK